MGEKEPIEKNQLLFDRILKLERSVFGGENDEWFHQRLPEPIDYRIKALVDQINDKFEDSFRDFLTKYKSSPLYSSSKTTATPSALGTEVQLDLLIGGQDFIKKTMSQLEEVDRLKGCINTEKLRTGSSKRFTDCGWPSSKSVLASIHNRKSMLPVNEQLQCTRGSRMHCECKNKFCLVRRV